MSDAKKTIANAAVEALYAISSVADIPRSSIDLIDKILHAIVGIADEIKRGLDGEVSAESIAESIISIREALATNDTVVDSAIDAKFPKDDGTLPP